MLQESTSSNWITFMERGLPAVFFPGRNMGAMLSGNLLEDRLLWQVGGFRDTDDSGFAFDSWGDEQVDIATRLAGAPIYANEGAQVLHLGGSYIHRFLDDTVRWRERPEANLAQRFVDTQNSFAAGGDIPANNADILNLELAGVLGPFSAQTEWTGSWVQGDHGQGDVDFWGIYVEASWFLTGEHKNYDLGNGRFGRIKPKANFDPADGGWGAWEIAARYSYLDLDDRNIEGGVLWDVTAGVNWYLYPNFRWMLNYVHGDVRRRGVYVFDDDDVLLGRVGLAGGADIVQTRFQVDF
jgi:phosphate-selective porin OprO/OprP